MSVYNKKGALALTQTELHLYGSSRLGVYNVNVDVQNCSHGKSAITTFSRGNKFFELSNHLGNVLATVSDKRLAVSLDGIFNNYYLSDVVTASDYAPFGSLLVGRQYALASSRYRYGFNGQENSDEIKGEGNSYTAEFWEYDPRIGRRWNLDPKPTFAISGYSAFNNNPIWFSDPLGDTPSNRHLVDALKIASAEIKSRINNKQGFYNDDAKNNLAKATVAYEEKNQLSFGDFKDFQNAVNGYYNGLGTIAMQSISAYEGLDNEVINNKRVNNKNTIIASVFFMRQYEKGLNSTMQSSLVPVYLGMTGGLFPEVGAGLRGLSFNSNTQQAIVESGAGFKFTNTTINRFIDPSRTVSAADLRRAVSGKAYTDPQGAAGANAYYTPVLRNGKSYNLKVIYNEETNTIFHFHYSRQAMGPLSKVKK